VRRVHRATRRAWHHPSVTTDPLAALLGLTDIAATVEAASAAVDAAFGHRLLRQGGGLVAAEVNLRSAVASAALEGSRYPRAEVRAGTVLDPVVQGALRVSRELDRLAPQWMKAPPQVLTRLHILAARGVVADLGRPAPSGGTARLLGLVNVLRSPAPALVRAATVHGELLALRAFEGPNGVVARAAGRLTLIAAGLDPRGLLPVDSGHDERQPEYVGAAAAYATGTPDGLRAWLKHCAAAVQIAATTLRAICDELSESAPAGR
jgi:hypothetical protein